MENAQKAIMIGVGLFITIIIIAAVMAITGMGQNLLNLGQSQLGSLTSQMQKQLTASYDGKQLSGSEILVAIQKYYTDSTMAVALYPTKGSFTNPVWTTPNKLTITATDADSKATATGTLAPNTADQPSYGSFTTPGSGNYVVTTAQYKSQLIEQEGAVMGVAFFRI